MMTDLHDVDALRANGLAPGAPLRPRRSNTHRRRRPALAPSCAGRAPHLGDEHERGHTSRRAPPRWAKHRRANALSRRPYPAPRERRTTALARIAFPTKESDGRHAYPPRAEALERYVWGGPRRSSPRRSTIASDRFPVRADDAKARNALGATRRIGGREGLEKTARGSVITSAPR